MISSIFYNGDGSTRIFPVTFKINGEDYVRVYVDNVEVIDRTKYDIINNSIVFAPGDIPAVGTDNIKIYVATSSSELGDLGAPLTDITNVANNLAEIVAVSTQVIPNLPEILLNESKAFVVDTVEDLLTIPSSYVTAVVRDLNRGGTFIWSAAGTANGGTVFAGSSGYWVRQYSGAVNVKWFGAKGDGVTDDTLCVQSAIDSVEIGKSLYFPSSSYLVSSLVVLNPITFYSTSFGRWGDAGAVLKLKDDSNFLIKIGDIENYPSNIKRAMYFNNIGFTGNNKTVSDALVVCEGLSMPEFNNCGFHSVNGNAVRMRVVWESMFRDCMFREVAADTSKSVIYIDSKYIDNNGNVNNVNFRDCHFESNVGSIFSSNTDSNLDCVKIFGSKFEWGLQSVPTSGPWALFNFETAFRIDISHNHFTNFKLENKYDTILYAGNNTDGMFTNNAFSGLSDTTYIAKLYGNSSVKIADNSSSDNIGMLYNESNTSQVFELPKNNINSSGVPLSREFINSHSNGFVSAHKFTTNNYNFVRDTTAILTPEQTVFKGSTPSATIFQIPFIHSGSNSALKFSIRCRSETGIGKINLQLKTTLLGAKTVPASYGAIDYFINYSDLATLGASANDRFKLIIDSTNTENIYVEGVYFNELSTLNANVPDPFSEVLIPNNSTSTFSISNATNALRRGLYLITASTPSYSSYALVSSNGATLYGILVGTDMTVNTTNLATSGKFNIFLSGTSLAINNLYGSDRTVSVYAFPSQH